MGSDGGQVVSVLDFYSVDPISNPAEVYSFNSVIGFKRTKINEKRSGLAHFFSLKSSLSYHLFLNREQYF